MNERGFARGLVIYQSISNFNSTLSFGVGFITSSFCAVVAKAIFQELTTEQRS